VIKRAFEGSLFDALQKVGEFFGRGHWVSVVLNRHEL
jgi:hypothetical protein